MSLVISADVTFHPADVDTVKAAAEIMVAASRKEPGCRKYAFAQDISHPELFRIIEEWDDVDALKAHFATPHMAQFNETLAACPPTDMTATRYDNAEASPLDLQNL